MELIDDWPLQAPVQAPAQRRKAAQAREAATGLTPQAIGDRLAGFEPEIVQLNCYTDVGYLWVQVSFDGIVSPGDALRVGQELAALAGEEQVLFNSLRPQAVYFVLAMPADPQAPELPAARYGTRLRDVEAAWKLAGVSRANGPARKSGAVKVSAPATQRRSSRA